MSEVVSAPLPDNRLYSLPVSACCLRYADEAIRIVVGLHLWTVLSDTYLWLWCPCCCWWFPWSFLLSSKCHLLSDDNFYLRKDYTYLWFTKKIITVLNNTNNDIVQTILFFHMTWLSNLFWVSLWCGEIWDSESDQFTLLRVIMEDLDSEEILKSTLSDPSLMTILL